MSQKKHRPSSGNRRNFRHLFIKMRVPIFLAIFLAIAAFFYATKIEPGWFEIVKIDLKIPSLSSQFNGFKIVQISDIHIGKAMTAKRLDRVVNLVNKQQPDVVAITGDFATENPEKYAAILTAGLQQLNPKIKTFAVLGNHDYWSNAAAVSKVLQASNILELKNRVYSIEKEGERLNFSGIDDVWAGKPDLDLVLKQLPDRGANVLLVHEPDFADTIAPLKKFDLQISGHSHGGQVRVPFFGAPILPYLGKKYSLGKYQVNDTIVYTNRGVGMVLLQLRFDCRPEITVFNLSNNSERSSHNFIPKLTRFLL